MKKKILEGPFYMTRSGVALPPGAKPPAKRKLNPGVDQLEEGFRSLEFQRSEIDQEQRIIPVVWASENPVERWFGREVLEVSTNSIRLGRFQKMGAFLLNHDSRMPLGSIVENSVSIGADRKARAKLQFSKNRDYAETEWKDVLDGIRGLFSVGYIVHRLQLVEEDDEKGDLWRAVDWEALEISLVSVPADVNCTLDGRSAGTNLTFPVSVIRQNQDQEQNPDNMNPRYAPGWTRFFHNGDNGGPAGGGGNGNGSPGNGNGGGNGEGSRNQTQPPAGNHQDEIARIREIGTIAARYGLQEKAAEWIEQGTSLLEVYRWLTENKIASRSNGGNGNGPAPLLTGGSNGAGNNTGTQMAPVARSIGQLLTTHDNFKRMADGKGAPSRREGFNFEGAMSFRATLSTSAIGASTIGIQHLPGIQTQDLQRLTIADLFAPGQTGSNTIEYLQEINYANAAAAVAEGGLKPEATFEFQPQTSKVAKIAVTAKISDEMLADFPFVQSFVDFRLGWMVEEREEIQLLNGDGNTPNLLGLNNVVGTQTQARGGDTSPDAIHKGITKVRVGGRAEPSGIVIHPLDWERIKLSKDANGQYLAGGPFYAPYGNGAFMVVERLWGLPVVPTTAATLGTAIVGAFRSQGQIFRRQGVTIETTNSNEDDFKRNLVAIRAEERLALVIYRPAAFCKVTGLENA